MSVPDTDAALDASKNIDRVLGILEREYPDYSVLDWPSEMREYRVSPEQFVGDLLFGDFNFDGVVDFAAMLTRDPTEDELAALPKRHRETIQRVGLVVVCEGVGDASGSSEFSCRQLADDKLGGFYGWLDLVDLAPWIDGLESEREEYGNPDCPVRLRSPSGQKLLSLVQPTGHCDVYFYPIASGHYGRCEYCAD